MSVDDPRRRTVIRRMIHGFLRHTMSEADFDYMWQAFIETSNSTPDPIPSFIQADSRLPTPTSPSSASSSTSSSASASIPSSSSMPLPNDHKSTSKHRPEVRSKSSLSEYNKAHIDRLHVHRHRPYSIPNTDAAKLYQQRLSTDHSDSLSVTQTPTGTPMDEEALMDKMIAISSHARQPTIQPSSQTIAASSSVTGFIGFQLSYLHLDKSCVIRKTAKPKFACVLQVPPLTKVSQLHQMAIQKLYEHTKLDTNNQYHGYYKDEKFILLSEESVLLVHDKTTTNYPAITINADGNQDQIMPNKDKPKNIQWCTLTDGWNDVDADTLFKQFSELGILIKGNNVYTECTKSHDWKLPAAPITDQP